MSKNLGKIIGNGSPVIRQHIGTVDDHELAKSISVSVSDMSPMVEFHDGTIVHVSWQELINNAVDRLEEGDNETE